MASIIVSFVGNQDPVSDHTCEDGSIVSLVRHLIADKFVIFRVILLYTTGTKERAELTKGWLEDTPFELPGEIIQIIQVDKALSVDPVNLLLAVQAARQGIESANSYLTPQDKLELNASSGTPVMKSAWSILQAAGYAKRSSVWQVRNPKEMQPGQPRVFPTNVTTLKNEFDFKVVQRQIHDYNYSGALATITETELEIGIVTALLQYGHHRLSFDFDRAFTCIQPYANTINIQLIRDISELRQRSREAILKEVYFKALTKLSNQEYADFLVLVFSFVENLLQFLTLRKLCPELLSEYSWRNVKSKVWSAVKEADQGKLYQYLKNYSLENNSSLRLEQELTRLTMLAIIEYYPEFSRTIKPVKNLEQYCKQRNDSVHHLTSVSEIEDKDLLLKDLRQILQQITKIPAINPFDVLNQQICSHMEIYRQ